MWCYYLSKIVTKYLSSIVESARIVYLDTDE